VGDITDPFTKLELVEDTNTHEYVRAPSVSHLSVTSAMISRLSLVLIVVVCPGSNSTVKYLDPEITIFLLTELLPPTLLLTVRVSVTNPAWNLSGGMYRMPSFCVNSLKKVVKAAVTPDPFAVQA
jgi:hypothetical protein